MISDPLMAMQEPPEGRVFWARNRLYRWAFGGIISAPRGAQHVPTRPTVVQLPPGDEALTICGRD